MKKRFKGIIATVLVFTMLFSMTASAADGHNSAIRTVTDIVGGIIDGAIELLGKITPTPDYPTVEEYFTLDNTNFYKGTESFIDEPEGDAVWSLGFSSVSLVPDNLIDGSKEYYTGGYFTQKINGIYDDQRATVIALNDGSHRGTTIFATIDGIGVGSKDIRAIRAAVERKLNEQGIIGYINAININATHCHTVIDTQGIGLDLILKILKSFFGGAERSIDSEFLGIMIDRTAEAIAQAYIDMEAGSLYYFETDGMGKDDENGVYPDDEYSYLHNKRYDTEGYQHRFACFKFVPFNAESAPTVFSNLGAHPTTISRDTELLSADFPRYLGNKLNEAGMNFMFIQGAQAPISVNGGGVKTQSVLDEVEAEIAADAMAAEYRTAKVLGYEFARLILDAQDSMTPVEPILNVRMKEYPIKLQTGLLGYGAIEGFTGTKTVEDSSSPTGYSVITEAGYIEIGKDIVLLTVPGELVPQLIYGNVVSAEESYLGTAWEYDATAALVPEGKTVLVMGLCNDALGYIVPDNDYAHFIADSLWDIDGAESVFGPYHRHYEELLATGSSAGSATVTALNDLVKAYNP